MSTGPSTTTRTLVIARAQGRCERCGTNRGTEIHHRRPRGMGGTRNPSINSPANLVYLCADCHRDIESHRTTAYADGWLLRHGHHPSLVAIPHHNLGRVYLGTDGYYQLTGQADG